jgi:FMN phosphatase YigB (HAD superfamily)
MILQALTLDLDDTLWPVWPTIRRALTAAGDDPTLAEPAFEVFFAERQRVDLYDDVLPGLGRHFHAGLQAAWVRRPDLPAAQPPRGTPQHQVTTLGELAERLGA